MKETNQMKQPADGNVWKTATVALLAISFIAFGLWFYNFGSSPITQNNNVASGRTLATVNPNDIISDITWKDYDNIFNINSKTTDLQKQDTWNRYKGKRVRWTGTVEDVKRGLMGGLTLNIKMNSDTITFDIILDLKQSEETRASGLRKGSTVTFLGTLENYGGAVLPNHLVDGVIWGT